VPGLRCETTDAQAQAIEDAVKAQLLAYARSKGFHDPIVRDLLPNEDLKGGNMIGSGNLWQQSVSTMTYVTVYSGENPDDRAFAIFMVANKAPNPQVVSIRFWDGTGRTALKDIWQVEGVWLKEKPVAYCDLAHIIFYPESKGYNIDLMAGLRGDVDNVILGGKVVEPRGKTITPSEVWL